MKVLVQRVSKATLFIEQKIFSQIGPGLLVYVGFRKGDTEKSLVHLTKKITAFRIFSDENGRMNKSLQDVQGEILLVSQFTLYASTSSGNRPSFDDAMEPPLARELYHQMIQELVKTLGEPKVKTGVFGAYMEIESSNMGPINFLLEHTA